MENKELIIALMGASGTGKSTFANLASGGNLGVGNGLRSCTSDVSYSNVFELSGHRVVLVDTPGFDDTTKSDTEILKLIAIHLSTIYEAGAKLSGIIYTHRISDPRMGGVSRRNFNMFHKLCGDEALKNVIIVTTMWGQVGVEVAERREKELMTDDLLFKPVLEKGAQMMRHDNTLLSAQAILDKIMQNQPEPLRIQRELVDKKMDISQTGAGEELAKELAAIMKRHKEDMEAVQKELSEALAAKDTETTQELEAARQDLIRTMTKVKEERDRLSREYAEDKQRASEAVRRAQEQLNATVEEKQRANEAVKKAREQVPATANRAREQVSARADRAREQVPATANRAREQVSARADRAREQVPATADRAREQVSAGADKYKHQTGHEHPQWGSPSSARGREQALPEVRRLEQPNEGGFFSHVWAAILALTNMKF